MKKFITLVLMVLFVLSYTMVVMAERDTNGTHQKPTVQTDQSGKSDPSKIKDSNPEDNNNGGRYKDPGTPPSDPPNDEHDDPCDPPSDPPNEDSDDPCDPPDDPDNDDPGDDPANPADDNEDHSNGDNHADYSFSNNPANPAELPEVDDPVVITPVVEPIVDPIIIAPVPQDHELPMTGAAGFPVTSIVGSFLMLFGAVLRK